MKIKLVNTNIQKYT